MHGHDLGAWQHDHRFQGDKRAAERSTRLVVWITAAAMEDRGAGRFRGRALPVVKHSPTLAPDAVRANFSMHEEIRHSTIEIHRCH